MYVIIEGIDGSGKDSQADLLVEYFEAQGHPVLRVNEPDSTLPTGKLLRQMLKDGTYVKAHAAMFLADRMAMLDAKVCPALAEGKIVVSVRSWLSTLVYQQENWPLSWLKAIHEQLPAKATHLVLLDLDPETALDRATRRPGHNEYYEKLDVQLRNRQRYRALTADGEAAPFLAREHKVIQIDASGTPAKVHAALVLALQHPNDNEAAERDPQESSTK